MRLIDDAMRELHRAAGAKLAYALALACCAAAAVFVVGASRAETPLDKAAAEWPTEWDGRVLRPLAATDVDRRFAAHFPGSIARLTDGHRQYVMRRVEAPTRMLHPASDCFRGSGYRIEAVRVERDTRAREWRCFEARRDGERVRVCERITDREGHAFTDTSAWFWFALLGRSSGPWVAVATAESVP
jgi:hypothetical protein